MTDVFLVRGNRYGFFGNEPNRDIIRKMNQFVRDGGPIPYNQKAELKYFSGDEPAPPMWSDFSGLASNVGLVLLHSTTLLLAPLLDRAGQVFPTNSWMGQQLDLLVVTALRELDQHGTEYNDDPDMPSFIRRFAFKEDDVKDSTLFRVQERPGLLFATNHLIEAVEANHLIGLDYQLVWSSEREPFDTPPEEFFFTDPMTDGKTMATHAREAMQAILDRRKG